MLQKKIGYINENPKKYAIVKASIDDPYIIDGVKRKWWLISWFTKDNSSFGMFFFPLFIYLQQHIFMISSLI